MLVTGRLSPAIHPKTCGERLLGTEARMEETLCHSILQLSECRHTKGSKEVSLTPPP